MSDTPKHAAQLREDACRWTEAAGPPVRWVTSCERTVYRPPDSGRCPFCCKPAEVDRA